MADDKVSGYLKEWVVNFERHRDIMKREIMNIDMDGELYDVRIQMRNGDRYYKVMTMLPETDKIKGMADALDALTIVAINNKNNLKVLIDSWNVVSGYPNLTFIFINPFSLTDKRWIIRPNIHSRVCEPSSLKPGLKTMFETVDPTSEDEFTDDVERQD